MCDHRQPRERIRKNTQALVSPALDLHNVEYQISVCILVEPHVKKIARFDTPDSYRVVGSHT